MASMQYHGKYKMLFPGILSSNSFLSVYVLHLLNRRHTMYGKEIVDGISDNLQGLWEPSHGLVYPLLRNLEEAGLVIGAWEGNGTKKTKRHYKITEAGKEVLKEEAVKIKPMFENSQKMIQCAMDDLYAI